MINIISTIKNVTILSWKILREQHLGIFFPHEIRDRKNRVFPRDFKSSEILDNIRGYIS